jgi:hypothetical protein
MKAGRFGQTESAGQVRDVNPQNNLFEAAG